MHEAKLAPAVAPNFGCRESFANVLSEEAFSTFWEKGHVDTGLSLSEDLKEQVRSHYSVMRPSASNWFRAYRRKGSSAATQNHVNKLKYAFNVYANHQMLRPVVESLLAQNLSRFFKPRYMLISHDIFLSQLHGQPGFGRHWDGPNSGALFEGTTCTLPICAPPPASCPRLAITDAHLL